MDFVRSAPFQAWTRAESGELIEQNDASMRILGGSKLGCFFEFSPDPEADREQHLRIFQSREPITAIANVQLADGSDWACVYSKWLEKRGGAFVQCGIAIELEPDPVTSDVLNCLEEAQALLRCSQQLGSLLQTK